MTRPAAHPIPEALRVRIAQASRDWPAREIHLKYEAREALRDAAIRMEWAAEDAWRDLADRPAFYEAIDAGRHELQNAGIFAPKSEQLPAYCDADTALAWAGQRLPALWKIFKPAADAVDLHAAVIRAGQYLQAFGIEVPEVSASASTSGRSTLASIARKVLNVRWLARRGRVAATRNAEAKAVKRGAVHVLAAPFATREAIGAYREQRNRNEQMLLDLAAVNETTGEIIPMSEIRQRSLANPVLRRGEMMARVRGLETMGDACKDVCLFVTLTLASRFHARLSKGGIANPKFAGCTPREAQAQLCAQWQRVRARVAKAGVFMYGFRAAEPHHDATPHWHLWLFVRGNKKARRVVMEALRDEAFKIDPTEPGAKERRLTIKPLRTFSGGGPAAYAAKYVSKHVDGSFLEKLHSRGDDGEPLLFDDAPTKAEAITVWSRVNGIRQFQFFGAGRVGLYREARRLRDPQLDLPLIEAVRTAADTGDYCGYIGAAERAGLDKLCEETPGVCLLNAYGERAAARLIGLTALDESVITRPHRWRIERIGAGVGAGRGADGDAGLALGPGLAQARKFPPLGLVSLTVTSPENGPEPPSAPLQPPDRPSRRRGGGQPPLARH